MKLLRPEKISENSPKEETFLRKEPFFTEQKNKYLIVGAGWAGQTMASILLGRDRDALIGFLDDTLNGENILLTKGTTHYSVPVVGRSSELVHKAIRFHVRHVVIAVTHDRADHLLEQIIKCHEYGLTVIEMPELYAHITGKIPVRHLNHRWIAPQLTAPKHDFYYFFYNTINYIFGLAGFIFFLLPFVPLLALAIKLDSRGPVFYRQKRVGKNEKVFTVIKFRTMRVDAENGTAVWAQKQDDRITTLGRFLRKFRLDEVPQFFNVLTGKMALIGPRPERPEFVESLADQIPFYNYRHLVRPGITGWAQVNYRYGNSVDDTLEKIQYDLYWIKNRSFWLDLKIILKSIKVILTGFGAI